MPIPGNGRQDTKGTTAKKSPRNSTRMVRSATSPPLAQGTQGLNAIEATTTFGAAPKVWRIRRAPCAVFMLPLAHVAEPRPHGRRARIAQPGHISCARLRGHFDRGIAAGAHSRKHAQPAQNRLYGRPPRAKLRGGEEAACNSMATAAGGLQAEPTTPGNGREDETKTKAAGHRRSCGAPNAGAPGDGSS